MRVGLDLAKDQLLSRFLERDHVGVMCVIIKNSGNQQTFHGESFGRECANNEGHRFFDLIDRARNLENRKRKRNS